MRLDSIVPVVFFRWCERMPLGRVIKQTTWSFAIIETVHIMALAILLGTMIVIDLRLMGYGMKRQSTAQLARFLGPWFWSSLIVMVLTGTCLFVSEAVRLSQSIPFAYKMSFLLA